MTNRLFATRRLHLLCVIVPSLCMSNAHAGPALEYRFEAAAQEITQLFWLADTANVCGWASEGDAAKFKQFSVRFLSAHLPEIQRRALLTLVQEDGYEDLVKRTALETAPNNCASPRWKAGWSTYWNAAEAHAAEY